MDKRMDNSQCSGKPRNLAEGSARIQAGNSKSKHSRLWDYFRSSTLAGWMAEYSTG
jgi:hypothetical protein